MKITNLMTQPVVEIDEDSSILDAAKKMSEAQIGSLIVTRNGKGIGIITEKDIISKVVAMEGDSKSIKVKSVMSTPLLTVEKDVDGKDAIKEMAKHNVNRLPIVDNGEIVGIFSTADIIKSERAFAKEIVEDAVDEYNKYRSPQVIARLMSIDDESATIRFTGSFCEECGKDNDYQFIEYLLGEKEVEAKTDKITELEEGEGAIVIYKIVIKTLQSYI